MQNQYTVHDITNSGIYNANPLPTSNDDNNTYQDRKTGEHDDVGMKSSQNSKATGKGGIIHIHRPKSLVKNR